MVTQLKLVKTKLLKAKKVLKKYKLRHLCVTITTNTSTDSKKIYFAPLRQGDDILIFGIIVYLVMHFFFTTYNKETMMKM